MTMELDQAIHRNISELCESGDNSGHSGDMREALRLYHEAWALLPEPKENWEAATWILSAIGDTYFVLGDFEKTLSAFSNAVHCPGGLGNPFIHLRIGESAFELGDIPRAKDELARAYMGAGKDIFAKEDPKYLSFVKSFLLPMQGHADL